MPAAFDQGFFVRKPAWHGLGVVIQDYPGRQEAMRLAGHDFELIEVQIAALGKPMPGYQGSQHPSLDEGTVPWTRVGGGFRSLKAIPAFKGLTIKQLRTPSEQDELHGSIVGVVSDGYTIVQPSVCWDIIDALIEQPNVQYETGGVLEGGATCFVTAILDEPRFVKGDESPIFPYAAVNWGNIGNGAVRCLSTTVREVCANTVAMAEAEADRAGRMFTFRHTKNVMARIEEARATIRGIAQDADAFVELANELGGIRITPRQRAMFVTSFIPTPPGDVISDRVAANIEEARRVVTAILTDGQTIPDAHRETGYGLFQAGVEYLDHLRGWRDQSTYVGRTLLRREPLKAKLVPLIREVALSA